MATKYTRHFAIVAALVVAAPAFAASDDLLLRLEGLTPISLVDPGTPMTITYRAINFGPDPAEVRVVLTLPGRSRFVSVSDPQWRCSGGEGGAVQATGSNLPFEIFAIGNYQGRFVAARTSLTRR